MYFKFHTSRVFTFSKMNDLWNHCSDTLSPLAFHTDSNANNFRSNSSSEEQSTRSHKFLSLFCTPNISSKNDFFNSLLNPRFSKCSSIFYFLCKTINNLKPSTTVFCPHFPHANNALISNFSVTIQFAKPE